MAGRVNNQTPESELELIGVDIFWAASKNREFRRKILSALQTLVGFLEEHNLTTGPLLEPGTKIDATFVLRQSQLTGEGNRFYRQVEQPWLRSIDRGGDPADAEIFKRALNQLRGAGEFNA